MAKGTNIAKDLEKKLLQLCDPTSNDKSQYGKFMLPGDQSILSNVTLNNIHLFTEQAEGNEKLRMGESLACRVMKDVKRDSPLQQ